jgi:hypothetical protein
MQDVKPPASESEHLARVLTRESTPWISKNQALVPKLDKKKDVFVNKYQILLDHV